MFLIILQICINNLPSVIPQVGFGEGMHTLPLPLWVQRLFPIIDPWLNRNVSEARLEEKYDKNLLRKRMYNELMTKAKLIYDIIIQRTTSNRFSNSLIY